jgi:PIN domain nuclease of toxin-antitoxin system
MTLLDAYGLVAYLAYEPCADEVEELLREGAHIASVNLAEVVARMGRLCEADVEDEISAMEAGGLDVVPLDTGLAIRAGELRGRRYDKRTADVSMADCVAAVTALHLGVPLATSDPALAAVLVAEGGTVIALPDSRGVRPT